MYRLQNVWISHSFARDVTSFRAMYRCVHVGEHFTRGLLNEIKLRTPVTLAGRKYLPSSSAEGMPKFLAGPKDDFPLLVKAARDQTTIANWAKRSREVIEEAYRKFEKDGTPVALLFRHLPIANEKDFSVWVNNLGYEPFAYVGGTAPRVNIARNVAAGASHPNEFSIDPHSEMAYTVNYPKMLSISSLKTAAWGGETAICDVREVERDLDPSFVEKCERLKIRYWHHLLDKNTRAQGSIFGSWQEQFATEDRTQVEDFLREKGYSFEWEEGSLFYWHNLGPHIYHPINRERLWFNQVAHNHCTYRKTLPQYQGLSLPNKKYPVHTTFGNGDEIEMEKIDEVRSVTWKNSIGFQWQDGDVLFLDQLVVQHSRLGFEGDRKVAISLLNY